MALGLPDVTCLDRTARTRVGFNLIGCVLLVLAALVVGFAAHAFLVLMTTWPYDIQGRRMVGENTTSDKGLVQVRQGGDIIMQRRIDYHEIDCERWYARMAVSEVRDRLGAVRTLRFPEIHDPQLPAHLSGRWQEWKAALSDDFPCGRGYLAETVTAECNWFHRNIRRLTKPTIITPFEVTGCGPPG